MVAVTITAPTGRSVVDAALIDTGADVSGFPLGWMRRLGVRKADCQKKPLETAAGIGHQWVYPGGVTAFILGCQMQLEAVFADSPVALLGRDDFLSHFRVVFDQRAFKVTLQQYEA